jgi:hypothetical protein
MRGIAVLVFSLAMVSGADASSILILSGKPAADPSIVKLGDAGEAASSIVAVGAVQRGAISSPSEVVLGDPAVDAGKVAAVPTGKERPRAGGVLVIRAGVVGGSSATPAATVASTAAPATSVATPVAGGSANDGGKTTTLRDAMTQAGQAPALPQ